MILKRLRDRGVIFLEIDSGAKPTTDLVHELKIPLQALNNANYASAFPAEAFDFGRRVGRAIISRTSLLARRPRCALSGSDGSQMREAGRHQASVGVKIDHGPAALWEEFPPFGCKPSRGRREMSLVG